MARNLQLLDEQLGLTANVKYEPLNKGDKFKQKVAFKAPGDVPVKLTTVSEQRKPVQTFKAYLDDSGNEYAKAQLTAFDPDTKAELVEFESTTIFNIVKYEPLADYTDRYIVDKYYELFASDDGKKKDIDRTLAANINRTGMKKLYDYLITNKMVGKAEFITTSGNYRAGAGYIRAITFDGGKWSLEIGAFKEEKVFKHLNEPKIDIAIAKPKKQAKNALI